MKILPPEKNDAFWAEAQMVLEGREAEVGEKLPQILHVLFRRTSGLVRSY